MPLGDLVRAARLCGVALPLRLVDAPPDRLADRLAGTRTGSPARDLVAAELARAEQPGDPPPEPVVAALRLLASGPLLAVLDVCAVRRGVDVRLRSWVSASGGAAAQLTTRGVADFELASWPTSQWTERVGAAVAVEPWVATPAPLVLPDHVALPTELLLGAVRACREHRPDLLPVLALEHGGAVRLGDAHGVRPAGPEEALALLRTLADGCRGRLRMLLTRRDRGVRPRMAAWLLLDDGWREVRPGRDATTVLRRRRPRDLGLLTLDAVAEVRHG